MAIYYIMYQKVIITAPITDATVLCDVVDSPSVCGAFNFKYYGTKFSFKK